MEKTEEKIWLECITTLLDSMYADVQSIKTGLGISTAPIGRVYYINSTRGNMGFYCVIKAIANDFTLEIRKHGNIPSGIILTTEGRTHEELQEEIIRTVRVLEMEAKLHGS